MQINFQEQTMDGGDGAALLSHTRPRERAGHGRIIRYRVDALSVSVVVATLVLQLTAYFMAWPWWTVSAVLLAVRQLHLVEHNHAHLKIFRQTFLNELLGWMCFVSNGVPLECYEMHHVQNHHRHLQRFDGEKMDWSSPFGFAGTRYPDKPVGRVYYCLTFVLLAWHHCMIEIIRRPGEAIVRRFARSSFICLGVCGALAFMRPWQFFLFFLIPWLVVYVGMASNNYDHHQNCKLTNPYDSANVDLRFPYRLFGFNIGYHVEHHIKPTLHWSLLPSYHRTLEPLIPEENYVIPPHKAEPQAPV
jgi:beta-carotene hydroxylase